MVENWMIIALHQIVFQGMFLAKNIMVKRKTGVRIRGKNKEATVSILFFTVFIVTALSLSLSDGSLGYVKFFNPMVAKATGLGLLAVNLFVSVAALLHLRDSWRVGVLEDQTNELVMDGIYRISRNPYFVSYLFMFGAYTILLQNIILLVLSILGFVFIHRMVLNEEKYLLSTHGESYLNYKKRVPRYFLI